MNNDNLELNVRENSLASAFEINQLMILFNRLEIDEPLNYSIISKMVDFITDYYYNKEKADIKVLEFLVTLYMSNHMHIREKISKALMKLLNKNFKQIRKALILSYTDDKPEHFIKDVDAMLSTVFSGIYFDYSTINEAKEELENMNGGDSTEEEAQDEMEEEKDTEEIQEN